MDHPSQNPHDMSQQGHMNTSGGYVPAPAATPGTAGSTPLNNYHPQHSQHYHHPPPPAMYEQHQQVKPELHQLKQEHPDHPYHHQQPSYEDHNDHPAHVPPPPSSSPYHHLPPPLQQSHHPIPASPHHQQPHQSYQHHQMLPQQAQPSMHPLSTQHLPLQSPLRPEDHNQTVVVDEQNLLPVSKVEEESGRKYALDVVQQPVRARMCGFGDKDRRPITPPPCVRLIITDARTGKEIDYSTLEYSTFVLNVDLWNESATKEVNLVRSSQDATVGAYGQIITSAPSREASYPPSMGFAQDYPTPGSYAQSPPTYPPNGTYGPPTQYFPSHHTMGVPAQGIPQYGPSNMVPPGYGPEQNNLARMSMVSGQPHGMFTRNLIGSTAAGAFRLSDTRDQLGIWFVLQDLSVRTEGTFRLKFSFNDVGQRGYNAPRGEDEPKTNTGRAPTLATAFTDPLMVYSAKKFPGVCESTPLSKTFATQGIKIPIRKDVKGGDGNDEDD